MIIGNLLSALSFLIGNQVSTSNIYFAVMVFVIFCIIMLLYLVLRLFKF